MVRVPNTPAGPILKSNGMRANFQKKEKKGRYLKIWEKCTV